MSRSGRRAIALAACALALAGCGSSGAGKSATTSTATVRLSGEPAAMKAVCTRLNDALASATAASNTLESDATDQRAKAQMTSATREVLNAWLTLAHNATDQQARQAARTGESYARAQVKAAAEVANGSSTAQGNFLDELQSMLPSLTAICG